MTALIIAVVILALLSLFLGWRLHRVQEDRISLVDEVLQRDLTIAIIKRSRSRWLESSKSRLAELLVRVKERNDAWDVIEMLLNTDLVNNVGANEVMAQVGRDGIYYTFHYPPGEYARPQEVKGT